MGGTFWNIASHTDGIVLHPTLGLDGEIIEENGIYIDSIAREFYKKLGVAGY